MSQFTRASRAAAELRAAAAAAHQIAARRETAPASEQSPAAHHQPKRLSSDHGIPSARLQEVAAGLSAAGVPANLHDIHPAGLYLIAAKPQPGEKDTEIILDENGYAELQWWPIPAASAEHVTALILSLLAMTTTSSALPAPEAGRP
jgi:hypothetical protein